MPCCSRCKRLKIACVGSGQQRFAFRDQKCPRRPPKAKTKAIVKTNLPWQRTEHVLLSPFLEAIRPDADPRFNLMYSYGRVLQWLPQRIGRSLALDASIKALILAHHDVCRRSRDNNGAAEAYNDAIHRLRLSIDHQTDTCDIHLIAAAAVLIICGDLNGHGATDWSIHSLGAVEILRARKDVVPRDEFEQCLLLYLQGLLVCIEKPYDQRSNVNEDLAQVGHCIFFQVMRLDPDRFEGLVNVLIEHVPCDHLLHYAYNLPRVLKRGRAIYCHGITDLKLLDEVATNYQTLFETKSTLRTKMCDAQVLVGSRDPRITTDYGFALCLCCVYHCLLGSTGRAYRDHTEQGKQLVENVLELADEVEHLAPLGSTFVFLPLSTTLLIPGDMPDRHRVECRFQRVLEHCYGRRMDTSMLRLTMEKLRSDLNFGLSATPTLISGEA
jgi:hypothetical protein